MSARLVGLNLSSRRPLKGLLKVPRRAQLVMSWQNRVLDGSDGSVMFCPVRQVHDRSHIMAA